MGPLGGPGALKEVSHSVVKLALVGLRKLASWLLLSLARGPLTVSAAGCGWVGEQTVTSSSPRSQVRSCWCCWPSSGAAGRAIALASALMAGVLLAIILLPDFGAWTSAHFHHHSG
jgi:hypothetical protein